MPTCAHMLRARPHMLPLAVILVWHYVTVWLQTKRVCLGPSLTPHDAPFSMPFDIASARRVRLLNSFR